MGGWCSSSSSSPRAISGKEPSSEMPCLRSQVVPGGTLEKNIPVILPQEFWESQGVKVQDLGQVSTEIPKVSPHSSAASSGSL